MTLRIGLLHLLLIFPAFGQTWTKADTAWEASCIALQLVDWAQTRQIAKHPYVNRQRTVMWKDGWGNEWGVQETYTEQREQTNLFLPKHPSVAEVDRFFVASIASHILAARLLHGKWRRGFQVFTLGMSVDAVNRNFKMGLRVQF